MGALVKLTLGRRALRFWVYVTEVTDFILGLEVLWAYNATVELVHNQLQMGQE
jgi:predicted nucleic acid-binding Zn finger protein